LDAAAQLHALLRLETLGAHLVHPWRVAVAGPPNVGKSSLINALVGYGRTIVHDQPGTTRDAVSVQLAVDGWPVELIDTAGLRESGDPLETAGILRALEELRTADMALLVFDATEAWAEVQAAIVNRRPDAVVVYNKSDLLASASDTAAGVAADTATAAAVERPASDKRPAGLLTSATAGTGLDEIFVRLLERLVPVVPATGAAVPFLPAQSQHLRLVLERLEAGNPQAALAMLS
jgi:tRNA modification GTPase